MSSFIRSMVVGCLGLGLSFSASAASWFSEDLFAGQPQGRLLVLSQVESVFSNSVVITVNPQGNYRLALGIPNLGWVDPIRNQFLTCQDYRIQRFAKVLPLMDCYPAGNVETWIPPRSPWDWGTLYYPNSAQVLRDSSGSWYYLNGVKLLDGVWKTLTWANRQTMVLDTVFGAAEINYPDARSLYRAGVFNTGIFYRSGSLFASSENQTSYRASPLDTIETVQRPGWRTLVYPTTLGFFANIYESQGNTYKVSLKGPNGEILKIETSPGVGKVFNSFGFETNRVSQQYPYPDGFISIEADRQGDLVSIVQTDSAEWTRGTHLAFQFRDPLAEPAVAAPRISIALAPVGVKLSWRAAAPNLLQTVEYRDGLSAPWQTFPSELGGTMISEFENEPLQYLDVIGRNSPAQRMYRLKQIQLY